MARPLSVTDSQILDAMNAALVELGTHGLSISEVARRVGLSRAAISQRFGTLDDLKRLLMKRLLREFEERLAAVRIEAGAPGLIRIAELVGNMIGAREQFSNFMFRYSININDPILIGLEEQRGEILRALIAKTMPLTAIETTAAVDAFMAHLTGSIMNWQASRHPEATAFLKERTLNWIRLTGIPLEDSH